MNQFWDKQEFPQCKNINEIEMQPWFAPSNITYKTNYLLEKQIKTMVIAFPYFHWGRSGGIKDMGCHW